MGVVDMKRRARGIRPRIKVSGDEIIEERSRSGRGRAGAWHRRAAQPPDRAQPCVFAEIVGRFLADAQGKRVVLGVAGGVGDGQNGDGRSE